MSTLIRGSDEKARRRGGRGGDHQGNPGGRELGDPGGGGYQH